eukprot:jgi/Orpsp1_1/1181740/evm.model.c7180000078411.1
MRDYLRLKKSNNNEQDTELKRFERYKSHGLVVYTYLPEELKYTIWPTVVAFSLTQKMWGYAIVSGIDSVTPSSVAWNQLVLPPATKEMLFATAAASLRGENRINCGIRYDELEHDKDASYAMKLLSKPPRYKARDIVSSRGIGSLFLLYGAPGTGKTLTVESLARLFGRPLYSVSFAELGSNVTELEERLTDVLFLASHWGSLILLDEGDALVEKRRSGQLMLNSMTSILLRLLESFDGTLFITSNRAASFDPAALSRVTLAIEYKPLQETGKELVWKNALTRVFADEILENNERRGEKAAEEYVIKNFDLNKLGQFKGSGRSVNAVIRLAIGLSDKRDETLSQQIVQDAIDVYTLFNDELLKECPKNMRIGPILTAKYVTSSLLKVALRDVMSSIWLQQSIVLIGKYFGEVFIYQQFFPILKEALNKFNGSYLAKIQSIVLFNTLELFEQLIFHVSSSIITSEQKEISGLIGSLIKYLANSNCTWSLNEKMTICVKAFSLLLCLATLIENISDIKLY